MVTKATFRLRILFMVLMWIIHQRAVVFQNSHES